ncbi:MAG: c-type cytochrome [Sulfuricaulis sp.]
MTRMSPIRRLGLFTVALVPALVFNAPEAGAAADNGAKPYAQYCAACHGSHGTGGVGVPLALPDFLAVADDEYLRKTIRLGRPGRVMPAFRQLSDAQVSAIVKHIRGWAPPGASAPARNTTPVKGNAGHGQKLFAQYCSTCHGNNGEGGQGTGVTFSRPRELSVLAPALNNPGFLAAAGDAMIKTTLMRGRQGTPMQSFLKQGLDERDIGDIVAYVRTFSRHPLHAARSAKDQPPIIVRESPYNMSKTIEKLKIAIGAANLRLIRVEPFDESFFGKNKEDVHYVAVDSCDFNFLDQALKIDPRVGLFLPCRFTLAEQDGKVRVMTINPKRLSTIFNNAELDQLCDKMYHKYVDILEEATF